MSAHQIAQLVPLLCGIVVGFIGALHIGTDNVTAGMFIATAVVLVIYAGWIGAGLDLAQLRGLL